MGQWLRGTRMHSWSGKTQALPLHEKPNSPAPEGGRYEDKFKAREPARRRRYAARARHAVPLRSAIE
jgi:hypothetical protein